MPELSIIVPVYKVEKYLPKCIDSILAQTFRDFELILIDDGSPDNCGAICDEYAARDSRIKVIHQKNTGVSAARNAGLDIASGTYLGFVDSDDWIEPEMYATMIATAKEKQVDVVVCGLRYVDEEGTLLHYGLETNGEYSRDGMISELFGTPNQLGGGNVNKLFSAAKIKKCRFDEKVAIAEDWIFIFNSFLECHQAIKLSQPFYTVVERHGSATRSENELVFCERLLGSSLLLLLLCREKAPHLEGLAVNKYLDDCLRYLPVLRATAKEYKRPYRWKVLKIKLRMLWEISRAWLKKLLPKAKIHGYIYGWFKV